MHVDLSVIKQYCTKIGYNCTNCLFDIGNSTCSFNDFPNNADISFIEAAYSKILEFKEAVEQPPTQAKAADALPKGEITPCARKKDCSYIRINGECMGPTCGVYLPA